VKGFLPRYFAAFDRIPGWFLPDAYLVIAAYNQLLADEGCSGDVLEIGVYHGLSAVGLAALRGHGRRFVAVDLFEKPADEHIDRSWWGSRASFLGNMARFYDDLSFVTTIASPSANVGPADLGSEFTLCHVDAGHRAGEVYADLELCADVSRPGGLVVLDDYSSPAFPGVAEGALRFNLDAPGTLRPIALGFNKAIFQREPSPFDLNARLLGTFPQMRSQWAWLWDVPVPLFTTSLLPFFDLGRSTPRRLAGSHQIAARIEPATGSVTACTGRTVTVPVQVTNLSNVAFKSDRAPFGVSYHLLNAGGALLKYDNARAYFVDPLESGSSRTVDISVQVPDEPGEYELEIDIVWEGILWLKDRGNRTERVRLSAVSADAGDWRAVAGA
jgi:SAM-dependent methyltransferase